MKNETQQVIVKQPENKPVAAEIIASSIVDIAESFKRISNSRLTRRAVITLIHEDSKIARRDIELVLSNLESLERVWLKPKQ